MAEPSKIALSSLLEHRQWVRALAYSLVRNEHDTDDLEQQTWLAALRRPPSGSAPRAWLGTVVRHLAGKKRRGVARLMQREQRAARPEALAATDELVAEAEAHRRVVQTVLELDEPYRSTLLARYFRDLTPRQIAERTGVPRETVRSHLRRGLARVRTQLEREDARGAWMVLVAPLLPTSHSIVPIAVVATDGAALVSKKVALVFVLWALVATALYTREVVRTRVDVPRVSVANASRGVRGTDLDPGVLTPNDGADRTARQELEAFHQRWLGSRRSALRGRLIHADTKEPLSIEAAVVLLGKLPDGEQLRYEVRTSATGSFSVPDVHYPLHYDATCLSEAEGVHTKQSIYVNEECAAMTLEIRPGVFVYGRVQNEVGLPVPQAQVHLSLATKRKRHSAKVQSNTDGDFRMFIDAPTGIGLILAASGSGHYPATGQLTQEGKCSFRGEIQLTRAPRIVGVVQDQDGKPLRDVTIQFKSRTAMLKDGDPVPDRGLWSALSLHSQWIYWPKKNQSRVTVGPSFPTDARGRFEGWCVHPDLEVWALIDHAGRPAWFQKIPLDKGKRKIDLGMIRLPAPGPDLGIVFQTPDRAPLARVAVTFSDATVPDGMSIERLATTDAAGVARSPFLVPGRKYFVRVGASRNSLSFEARDGLVVAVPAER